MIYVCYRYGIIYKMNITIQYRSLNYLFFKI